VFHQASWDQLRRILDVTYANLPLPAIKYRVRSYDYENGQPVDRPHEETVNEDMRGPLNQDAAAHDPFLGSMYRYVGVLADRPWGDTLGVANNIPSQRCTAWTDDETTTPHELGHTFGLWHCRICDAVWGCEWAGQFCDHASCPTIHIHGSSNAFAFLRSTQDKFSGFLFPTSFAPLRTSFSDRQYEVIPGDCYDLMGYCRCRWVSAWDYGKIMGYIQGDAQAQAAPSAVMDRLMIHGQINLETNAATVAPIYLLPQSEDVDPLTPGSYAIVLRNVGGGELARYPFAPEAPAYDGGCDGPYTGPRMATFGGTVPWVAGIARVEIVGPSGLLASVAPGTAAPQVTLTSPNGGEVLAGDAITVTWTANDADGDPLSFIVQYSADGGATWTTAKSSVRGSSTVVDRLNVSASNRGLFRVGASDGLHSVSDASDAVFTVANQAPTVEIVEPESGLVATVGQAIGLVALAYDADSGSLDGAQVQWYSSLDGLLGTGSRCNTAGLSAGPHVITAIANDNMGGVGADTIQVTVYEPGALPPQPDVLAVGPMAFSFLRSTQDKFSPAQTYGSGTLSIYNKNNATPLGWTAQSSQPWLHLAATSGVTPARVGVAVDAPALPDGAYTATITVRRADNPAESVTVEVSVRMQRARLYLPLLWK
jgi:hypothetical protein